MQTLTLSKPHSFPRPPHSNTKQINDYLIDLNAMIGEGSFSKVYKGTNLKTNETVAVKIVQLSTLKTDTLIKLLQSEIDILKVLKHPNVLNCYQVLSSSNNCYIVTEYCNGGDLETHIQKRRALSDKDFKRVVWEAYQGLKYIAGMNIIHRDFKIANIFLNNGVAKLADFGFAQRLKHSEERFTDVNIGSPVYMAPEAMTENLYGPKTDVWAFGILLYEIVHGDTPLGYCQTEDQLFKGAKRQLTVNDISPNVNAQLRDLILRCLQVDERRRINIAQIGQQPYMLQLQSQFGKDRNSFGNKLGNKQFESTRISTQNSSKVSHLNIPGQNKSLSHMSIGPSIASQLVIGGNTDSRRSHLNSIIPSSNSQIVILNNRNSSQGPRTQTVINPQMQNSVKPQMNFLKQANQPGMLTTTIINKPNVTPTNLIQFKISFSQCVQLLHYCRLVHKCIITGSKIVSCGKVVDYLSAWLLGLTEELRSKCSTFVQFDGERAPLREKKLSDLVEQYYVKYRQELRTTVPNPTHSGVYSLIRQALMILDRDIHLSTIGYEVDMMVREAHLLAGLFEINTEVQKGSQSGDFSRLSLLKMDDFLNRPNESFSIESYNQIKGRLINLFR